MNLGIYVSPFFGFSGQIFVGFYEELSALGFSYREIFSTIFSSFAGVILFLEVSDLEWRVIKNCLLPLVL